MLDEGIHTKTVIIEKELGVVDEKREKIHTFLIQMLNQISSS